MREEGKCLGQFKDGVTEREGEQEGEVQGMDGRIQTGGREFHSIIHSTHIRESISCHGDS